MFRLASVDLLELDAPTTHLVRFLPSLTCGPPDHGGMWMLRVRVSLGFHQSGLLPPAALVGAAVFERLCGICKLDRSPKRSRKSGTDGAVARNRKSKAPFTFALQLMVPGPPYRALVIAWAADSDPSALAEAAPPRAWDASCADDDSDSELAPFELALARCAQLAEVGYHGLVAGGSTAGWRTPSYVAKRMHASHCDGTGISSVKQESTTLVAPLALL